MMPSVRVPGAGQRLIVSQDKGYPVSNLPSHIPEDMLPDTCAACPGQSHPMEVSSDGALLVRSARDGASLV
jgi:hypothetical protein